MNKLSPLWWERYSKSETAFQTRQILGVPTVAELNADYNNTCIRIARNELPWPPPAHMLEDPRLDLQLGDYTVPFVAGDFNIHHPGAFRMLPSVGRYLRNVEALARTVGTDPEREVNQAWSVLFHTYHWRMDHKPVYVLSSDLWELLRNTTLPDWDFHNVSFPHPTFYLVFPPNAFSFEVMEDNIPQPAEGIYVSVDRMHGDPSTSRELSVLTTGRSKIGSWDDNLAWGMIGIGPHTKLPDVHFHGYDLVTATAGTVMAYTLPHIILAFALYLDSQNPDMTLITPEKPRNFSTIKSDRQRKAAEENERNRLNKVSRCLYTLVGGNIHRQFKTGVSEQFGRKLTVQQEVAGHFKMQPYGPQNSLRKKIFIHEYLRGPDFAEQFHT